jgi:ascorbate-specific PTS system EIIC-type component UlaA
MPLEAIRGYLLEMQALLIGLLLLVGVAAAMKKAVVVVQGVSEMELHFHYLIALIR